MKKHLRLFIEGIVQGVGFRPHVYNLARSLGLSGYVLNDSRGVTIEAEAPEEVLKKFRDTLFSAPPRLADIQGVTEEFGDKLEFYKDFIIRKSMDLGGRKVLISPDIATCDDCLAEMRDPKDPRYRYPFINCTNCGPRFTIITDVPYDRRSTSMADFPMCEYCMGQYENPTDRRFHAQPVACPKCGPRLFLYDNEGTEICPAPGKVIEETSDLLKTGKILAIKGLGGYHLAADAENEKAVRTLRERKYREDKPFAVMAPDVKTIRRFCRITKSDEKLLKSYRSPIVILEKLPACPAAASVAPRAIEMTSFKR